MKNVADIWGNSLTKSKEWV